MRHLTKFFETKAIKVNGASATSWNERPSQMAVFQQLNERRNKKLLPRCHCTAVYNRCSFFLSDYFIDTWRCHRACCLSNGAVSRIRCMWRRQRGNDWPAPAHTSRSHVHRALAALLHSSGILYNYIWFTIMSNHNQYIFSNWTTSKISQQDFFSLLIILYLFCYVCRSIFPSECHVIYRKKRQLNLAHE